MNYLDVIADEIGAQVGDCPYDLLRIYAVLALTTGTNTTRKHVHDAWSAWCAADNPQHRALIPYDQLRTEGQALDEPYAKAIRSVAARHGIEDDRA